MHPKTHVLALAINSAKRADDYEDCAESINAICRDMTDTQKADLYALIQEAVNETMTFVELTDAIDGALMNNEAHFSG